MAHLYDARGNLVGKLRRDRMEWLRSRFDEALLDGGTRDAHSPLTFEEEVIALLHRYKSGVVDSGKQV